MAVVFKFAQFPPLGNPEIWPLYTGSLVFIYIHVCMSVVQKGCKRGGQRATLQGQFTLLPLLGYWDPSGH